MVDKELRKKFQKIIPVKVNGTCYRAVDKKYDNPISTEGSEKASGRWHVKGKFRALYMCESENVCIEELKRRVDDELIIKNRFNIYKLEISVSKILDLTSEENLSILGIKKEELLSGIVQEPDTVKLPNALAELAYEAGFEGKLVESATLTGNNIVLFPVNISKKSTIKIVK